ncbi:MAG: DUF4097 domain-containing protein [Acidobacteriota bacterium]|nr:DUF4097 domain-containing protein [Acidobacteriota bacterium]
MKGYSANTPFFRHILLLAAILCLSASAVFAQGKNKSEKGGSFCDNYNYSSADKVSHKELREAVVSGGGTVNVDARRNGGIRVRGENRSDVLVRACIQTRAATEEEARAIARGVRIETGSTIRAEGGNDETNWAVSYEILVPRATNLKLTAHNGGIHISSVEGAMEFETTNGGVHLSEVGGDVRGKTTNGGVHVSLSGGSWRGNGLNLETSNGGVHLSVPENFAARVEVGTTNGGFKSDFPALSAEKPSERNGWNRQTRVTADLNGGGAPIRIITTNGGVKISSSSADRTM